MPSHVVREGAAKPPHRTGAAREVSDFCRQRQRLCEDTATVPQVAILLDTPSAMALSPAVANAAVGDAYDDMQGLLHAALDAGHSVDILTDFQLAERATDYPVIILPAWETMTEETITRLKDYAEHGGSLLVTGANTTKIVAEASVPPSKNDIISLGKGRIAAIPESLGKAYFTTHAATLRDRLDAILRQLYLPAVSILSRDCGNIDLTLRRRGKSLIIHLTNLNNIPTPTTLAPDRIPSVGPVKILVRNQPIPKKITQEPEGAPFKVEPAGRNFTITLPRLHIHTALVLTN